MVSSSDTSVLYAGTLGVNLVAAGIQTICTGHL
jgi:hypothetical protein